MVLERELAVETRAETVSSDDNGDDDDDDEGKQKKWTSLMEQCK